MHLLFTPILFFKKKKKKASLFCSAEDYFSCRKISRSKLAACGIIRIRVAAADPAKQTHENLTNCHSCFCFWIKKKDSFCESLPVIISACEWVYMSLVLKPTVARISCFLAKSRVVHMCMRGHAWIHSCLRPIFHISLAETAQVITQCARQRERSHCNVDPDVARMRHQSRLAGQMKSKRNTLGPQTDKRLRASRRQPLFCSGPLLPSLLEKLGEGTGWAVENRHVQYEHIQRHFLLTRQRISRQTEKGRVDEREETRRCERKEAEQKDERLERKRRAGRGENAKTGEQRLPLKGQRLFSSSVSPLIEIAN